MSTVLDLAKWDAALSSRSFLRPPSRTALWSPVKLADGKTHPYGFGWFLDPYRGHVHQHHGGGIPGFQSEFHRFPSDRLTVIVLANTVGVDLDRIALTVAGMVEPSLAVPPERPIVDESPAAAAKVRALVAGFAEGVVQRSLVTAELARLLEGDLKGGLKDAMKALGPITSVHLMSQKQEPLGNSRRYLMKHRNPYFVIYVTCVIDKDGKIARLSISE